MFVSYEKGIGHLIASNSRSLVRQTREARLARAAQAFARLCASPRTRSACESPGRCVTGRIRVPFRLGCRPVHSGKRGDKPGATIAEAQVFKGFGCEGKNVSPSLAWRNAPAGTKSFAITVYDPDAPTGSGWWHWIVFDIPADVTSLPAGVGNPASGQTPKGAVQSKNDFGKPGYGGPCPPQGDKPHR